MRKIVFVFAGQGAHHYHMARGLYDSYPEFRRDMRAMDEVITLHAGDSVLAQLYGQASPSEPFDDTRFTHPAIYMVEVSIARFLMRRGIVPDLVLGASLGTFAAAAIGGYVGINDGLISVVHQAATIARNCVRGSMFAVVGNPLLEYRSPLSGYCDLAAINCPSQFVLSAREKELDAVGRLLLQRNLPFSRLPVSHPFHSRWLHTASEACRFHLRSLCCGPGIKPMACCLTAGVIHAIQPDYFWSAAREPVRVYETVCRLEENGIYTYVDVGPSGSMATLIKQCLPLTSASRVTALLSPWTARTKSTADILKVINDA